ncbi:MAG: DUF4398 domain-containing protein [Bdellovibrionales bacterium]
MKLSTFQAVLKKISAGLILALCFFMTSCQTGPMPVEDYSLARVALEAAREVQAPRHAPGFWHQAEEAYRKARLLYKDGRWDEARAEFIKARIAAEKAENAARLIRQRTGDVL